MTFFSNSKSRHTLCSTLILMAALLFLAACQADGKVQSTGSLEADGDFSTAIPLALEKIPVGSTFSAELSIDGGAPIFMTVSEETVSVTTPQLSAGSHTFTITYFMDGKRIALAETSATIVAGQSTPIIFELSQLDQDLDKDGISGIDEVIAGSDPDDATSKPNQAPNSVINTPTTDRVILKGQGLTFKGTGTDPDGDLGLDFLWKFGGGAADSFFEDPGFIPFASTGLFPLRMTATDSLGLADPSPAYRLVGVANQKKLSATRIATGRKHTCAIVDDGAVKCWGINGVGELGQGDTANRGDGAGEMGDNLSAVSLGSGRSALAISAGGLHTCALLDNASVKCWGSNGSGQLGQGDTVERGNGAGEMGDNLPAIALGTGHSALGLSVGEFHSCVLLDNASVKCWGSNFDGELGQGDTLARGDGAGEMGKNLLAVSLGTGRSALAIAVGFSHSCALLDNASVKCWGTNGTGQLGQGDTANRGDGAGEMGDNLPAVSIGTGRTALAIATGGFHTCALLDDGSVKCWGNNFFGQLGQGDTLDRGDGASDMGDTLSAISIGTGRTALAIVAGSFHTCALLDNGSVKCWGANAFGQLGQGDLANRGDGAGEMGDTLSAISLGTGRTALAITAGFADTCVLLDDASVKCWGSNGSGELGQGDTLDRGDGAGEMGDNLPVVFLGTGRSALAIAAGSGGAHACALLDDASIKCWGANANGQLGQGDTAIRGDAPNEMGGNLFPIPLGFP